MKIQHWVPMPLLNPVPQPQVMMYSLTQPVICAC